MARPKIHSYAWSDHDDEKACYCLPLELRDKELRVWVTYPEAKSRHSRKERSGKSRKDLRLFAVVVIEALEEMDDFTFEVSLRRVFKTGERFIRVRVSNDPSDPSEEASVFSFVHPRPDKLDPLEKHLCMVAAKRVYDAIAVMSAMDDAPVVSVAGGVAKRLETAKQLA